MLYQTRDHSPSAINHAEHDLPTLSGLKYMPRLTRSKLSLAARPSSAKGWGFGISRNCGRGSSRCCLITPETPRFSGVNCLATEFA